MTFLNRNNDSSSRPDSRASYPTSSSLHHHFHSLDHRRRNIYIYIYAYIYAYAYAYMYMNIYMHVHQIAELGRCGMPATKPSVILSNNAEKTSLMRRRAIGRERARKRKTDCENEKPILNIWNKIS